MSERVCRWGILSTAVIARKNWQAIKLAGNATVAAVASRSLEKSQQFIAECQSHVPFATPPQAMGSYEELLASPDVDAVYIPLPTGIRKDWVVRAANAGKHVLVEKPVGVTASDVSEMLEACRKNNVQFMDGVMFMHSKRLDKLRAVLDDGVSVGRIRRIATQFSFCAGDEFMSDNIRVKNDLEPLGCLGDLGWYNLRFTLWTMKYEMPTRVSARLLKSVPAPAGGVRVPLEFSAELFFPGEVTSSFYCSFVTENQQWANISGTKGFVRLDDFVLPYYGSEAGFEVVNATFEARCCDMDMHRRARREYVSEYSNSGVNSQETNLLRNFSSIVLSGQLDPTWGEIALKTQRVMDACVESANRDGAYVTP